MDKGTKLYQEMMDGLVKMSRSCAGASNLRRGKAPGDSSEQLNLVLSQLSEEQRNVLADYLLAVYVDGIYDTLDHLEWLRCVKNMSISLEGEELPVGKYEGLSYDFIGRRQGWEWPCE